jgi:hypothetical protein
MTVTTQVMRAGATTPHPFTIGLVANPALEAPWNSGTLVPDPIIGDLPAFQAAAQYIDSSLFCLQLLCSFRGKQRANPLQKDPSSPYWIAAFNGRADLPNARGYGAACESSCFRGIVSRIRGWTVPIDQGV